MQKSSIVRALKAAFPLTIPVMTGYLFLGAAFGILLSSKGYSFWWSVFMSVFIYAGSMQFVSINLLTAIFNPLNAFLMTLMVNARHLFYGISMLGKYRNSGRKKPYLIFALTDETFSVVCSSEPPEGVDKGLFMFMISLLDQLYWVAGSAIGGILGAMVSFSTKGIDFVMTALFVVIFINQWKSQSNHLPALTGITASVLCLIIFGPANFIIPSMILIVLLFTALEKQIKRRSAN